MIPHENIFDTQFLSPMTCSKFKPKIPVHHNHRQFHNVRPVQFIMTMEGLSKTGGSFNLFIMNPMAAALVGPPLPEPITVILSHLYLLVNDMKSV